MNKQNKILLYDIETTPLTSYTWGTWQQDVVRVEKEWIILSFAYKWLGESKTYVVSLPNFKGYGKDKNNDKDLVKKLWDLINEADVVVAHNGNSFDIKKSNARFAFHGFTPPSPYKTVDTLSVAKRYFKFTSNRLGELGKYLGLGDKLETGGFDTWLGCMNGDVKSWLKMCKYNKQDVVLLEKVYLKLLPWIKNHPSHTSSITGVACNNCGSNKLQSRGVSVTKTGNKKRVQCQDCGTWGTLKID